MYNSPPPMSHGRHGWPWRSTLLSSGLMLGWLWGMIRWSGGIIDAGELLLGGIIVLYALLTIQRGRALATWQRAGRDPRTAPDINGWYWGATICVLGVTIVGLLFETGIWYVPA